MQFEEISPATILPVKEKKIITKIEDIEKSLQNLIAEKGYKTVSIYNKYSAAAPVAVYRDLLKNLEDYYKNLPIESDEHKVILSKIFDTLKNQFNIIETIKVESNSEEILVLLFTTIFLHLKRFLS